MRDTLIVTARIKYDWCDRLRILFGRLAMVQTRVEYEGNAWCEKDSTSVWVQPFREGGNVASIEAKP